MRRRIVIHKSAVKYLEKMPADRKAQVFDALREIAAMTDPSANANVRKLAGAWEGAWRLRIGSYRVIFKFNLPGSKITTPPPDVLEVLQVGPRGDIYK
jgi:mRNA interferase RelE/StbE